MQTFLTFATAQDARTYRYEHGTGGWIFAPQDASKPVVLFPPDMCPTAIFHHAFRSRVNGRADWMCVNERQQPST